MTNNLEHVCVKQCGKPSSLTIFFYPANQQPSWPASWPAGFFMPAKMSPVGAGRARCSHLSATFPGVCFFDADCEMICIYESPDNIDGTCDGFPAKCYCETQCPP
jgi:hypothetical protein